MAPEAPSKPLARRPFATWLVTGPIGRFLGFWLDLARVVAETTHRRLARRLKG